MAKSIVTWCDVCLTDDDVYTEARTISDVLIGRAKPKALDLCEQHEKQYLTPFVELVQRLGITDAQTRPVASPLVVEKPAKRAKTPVEKPTPSKPVATKPKATKVTKGKQEKCLVCGESATKTSIAEHYKRLHPDVSRAREMLKAGVIDAIFECPAKGCTEAFPSNQAMKMHMYRTHGVKHADQ